MRRGKGGEETAEGKDTRTRGKVREEVNEDQKPKKKRGNKGSTRLSCSAR